MRGTKRHMHGTNSQWCTPCFTRRKRHMHGTKRHMHGTKRHMHGTNSQWCTPCFTQRKRHMHGTNSQWCTPCFTRRKRHMHGTATEGKSTAEPGGTKANQIGRQPMPPPDRAQPVLSPLPKNTADYPTAKQLCMPTSCTSHTHYIRPSH